MQLPEPFVARMRARLGAGYPAFAAALDEPRTRGLRVNTAKTSVAELTALLDVALEPVPWCPDGLRLPSGVSLGGHPAHLAGLFYLQEPSAMLPAELLAARPGETVVDLAAAPGGKTVALSAAVGPAGLVVANEVVAGRLRALHDSLDLWGAANVVTASRPLDRLDALFDAALLDAPCSGEGLFRRDPGAVREWSEGAVRGSARRQGELLDRAGRLVRPGGALVYSTCTFETEENEDRVAALADAPEWTVQEQRTLWPHRVAGEGQFAARLVRAAGSTDPVGAARVDRPGAALVTAWRRFAAQALPGFEAPEDRLMARAERLYLAPRHPLPPVDLVRPGLPLGRLRPGRFEPHPALATAVDACAAAERVPSSAAYLRGETVPSDGPDGIVLVCFERWGIGWARRSQGVLKNLLPGHVRRQAQRWAARRI